MTLNDKLEQFFKAHPNEWIDGKRLAEIAGGYAWRTRVSNLRKRGLTIENRVRPVTTHNVACNDPSHCICRPQVFKVSEYRYVVPAPSSLLEMVS